MFNINGCAVYFGTSNTTITDGVTSMIEVFVPEFTPNALGKIEEIPTSEPVTLTNPLTDEQVSSTIPKSHTIKAFFFGKDNELVPCVHIGEQVIVYQLGGGDTNYYWTTIGRDMDNGIRCREHVRWYAMARPKSIEEGKVLPVSDDTSYFIDINTNKGEKIIHIHTSIVDGEPTGYDIRIMPEKSRLEIVDTDGNELSLESKKPVWLMRNNMGSLMELNKENINITCNGTITLNGGKEVVVNTPKYTNNGVQQLFNGSTSTTKMSAVTTDASNVTVNGSAQSYTGAITFGGPSFVVGSASGVVPVIIVYGSSSWG